MKYPGPALASDTARSTASNPLIIAQSFSAIFCIELFCLITSGSSRLKCSQIQVHLMKTVFFTLAGSTELLEDVHCTCWSNFGLYAILGRGR